MKEYKIEFIDTKTRIRESRYFNTFEDAMKWGKKNIDNFTDEMIQYINMSILIG